MKIVENENIIEVGPFPQTPLRQQLERNILMAIQTVEWPIGSGGFTINPQVHGNGVKPIKDAFIAHLTSVGWSREVKFKLDLADISPDATPGPLDAAFDVGQGQYFCAEWETGNISSSHRALNKIALGMVRGILVGGILVVPSAKLYPYLTDRIGNFRELAPYFPMWRALQISNGLLKVIAIEHDAESANVPLIGKGTDGRALR